MHTCISKLTMVGSDDLSPGRRQAIIWTSAGILLSGTLGTNFNETLTRRNSYIFIQGNAFENIINKMADILSLPQCVHALKAEQTWPLSTFHKFSHVSVYQRLILAFGYCRCMRLCVSVCVYQSWACPCNNSLSFQVGNNQYGPKVQNTLITHLKGWAHSQRLRGPSPPFVRGRVTIWCCILI